MNVGDWLFAAHARFYFPNHYAEPSADPLAVPFSDRDERTTPVNSEVSGVLMRRALDGMTSNYGRHEKSVLL